MALGTIRCKSKFRDRPWARLLLLLCLTMLAASIPADENSTPTKNTDTNSNTFPIEYEMALEPFQVFLEYDDNFPMAKSDEMIVLTSTQYFLSSQLEATESDFARLVLYQYVRDYVMETQEHFSKIAMNGMVFFTLPITDELRSRVVNQIFKNMSADSHVYVDILRSKGMDHVVNATLLSMQGNEMMYQDGEMIEMNDPESRDTDTDPAVPTTTTITRDMEDDMKNKVLLLCLIVPVIVLVLAAAVFALRFAREVNWRGSPTQDEKLWQRSEIHRAKRKKKNTDKKSSKQQQSQSQDNSDTGDSSRGHDDDPFENISDISFETSTEV